MTDLREAAQQALEALEGGGDSWRLIGPAIDALRAALEQPEHPPMRAPKENDRVICIEDESLGTVLWTDAAGGPYIKFDDGSYGQWMLHEFGKLFRYAALEQPEQEPVDTEAALRLALDQRDWAFKQLQAQHPRREWRGLTDEEVDQMAGNTVDAWECARAIEAALRSKNYD